MKTIHADKYLLISSAFFCRRYRLHNLFHQKISELFGKIQKNLCSQLFFLEKSIKA